MQEEIGLQGVTDGEFRRGSWHMDFLYQIGGVTKSRAAAEHPVPQRERHRRVHPDGAPDQRQARLDKTIFGEDFAFLKSVAKATPKLTIPSPSMVHYRGGRAAIDEGVYPEMEAFWHDLAAVYAEEIARLHRLGCTYLQLDDTSLAYLNDPAQRAYVDEHRRRRRQAAPDQHPSLINAALAEQARRHDRVHAYVPRQFPLLLDGRGRLRPRRRGAVRRARGRRLLSRIRRCPLGRVRAAAFRAQGQQAGRARARHEQARGARKQGRAEAPHRRGREIRAARAALPVARNAASRRPSTATH